MSKINTDKLLERVESLFEDGRCRTCYMEGAYCQEMKNDVTQRCVFMEIIEHLGELNSPKQHENDGCVKLNTSNEAKEVCEDENEMV